ncbi:hypothetical protein Tco_1169801 [Tanacetum coccineum]
MIGTRPLLHNKIQDKRALKFKNQGHKRDLNDHPLGGESFPMTEEEIKNQKNVEQDIKTDMSKKEMLNIRAQGRITNYDVLSRGKGPITLKVYMDDGFDEIIQNFKASDLHLGEWREVMQFADHQAGTVLNEASLGMILFNSHKRQDFVSIEDFNDLNNEMLYNVQEIFFRHHKGPGINDLAKTFDTFLVAEVDKRNLNPPKQMRVIEQLRQ